MENTPEAAAPATEATNTNTNPTPAPAEAPAQAAPAQDMHGFTGDQLAEMAKFMEANGGYDKAFKTFKDRISNPAPETTKEVSAQPAQSTQPTVEEQAQKIIQTPAGYMSQQEFMAQQYYNSLANQDEYAPIADKIRSGEVFNEMRKFGIQPMDKDGNINDVQAREFLSLLAKTVPAKPAETPEAAAAPTVDYVPTNDGKVESFQQASRIIAQSADLKGRGLAEHPQIQAAKDYVRDYLAGKIKQCYNDNVHVILDRTNQSEDTALLALVAVFFVHMYANGVTMEP